MKQVGNVSSNNDADEAVNGTVKMKEYINMKFEMKPKPANPDEEDIIDVDFMDWMKNNSMRIRRYSEIQETVRMRYANEYVETVLLR